MPGTNRNTHDDKFYTPADTANQLFGMIASMRPMRSFRRIIEPSAGNGAILKPLKARLDADSWDGELLAYDLMPEDDGIERMDWLAHGGDADADKPDYNGGFIDKKALWDDGRDTLVIGNPPFGRNGSLALRFIDEAASFDASMIAFILPKSFMKASMQRRIHGKYAIDACAEVSDDRYILPDGGFRRVPTCILILTRQDASRSDDAGSAAMSALSAVGLADRMPFTFCSGDGIDGADWMIVRVGGSAGLLKPMNEMTGTNRKYNYFIRMKADAAVSNADMPALMARAFTHLKGIRDMTAGPRSVSKTELMEAVDAALRSEETI